MKDYIPSSNGGHVAWIMLEAELKGTVRLAPEQAAEDMSVC